MEVRVSLYCIVFLGIFLSLAAAEPPSPETPEPFDRIASRIAELEARAAVLERAVAIGELARVEREITRLRALLRVFDPAGARDSSTIVEHVTVTATTSELPSRRAAVPTQVIDADEIRSRATVDAENVLDAVPGILVQRNTPFTLGGSTIHFQGADPSQVAVLLDGRPFLGGIDGVVDLRNIPVGNVDRVEIVRGPGSALYGSQAMAGVVNFLTREGGDRPSFDVTAAGGDFGRAFLAASHGGAAGRLRYFVSAQATSYRPEEQWGEISSQLDDDARQDRTHGSARVELPFERDRVALDVDFLEDESPMSRSRHPSARLSYARELGVASTVELFASTYDFRRENDTPGFEEEREYDDRRAGARYKHAALRDPVGGIHVLTAGGEARREELSSPVRSQSSLPGLVPQPVQGDVDQETLYAQDEIFFGERWSVALGASFDDHDLFGREASPRIAASRTLDARTKLSVAWGEGFRAPNLLQLFDHDVNILGPSFGYQIVGNPELQPETNVSWNAQVDWGVGPIDGFVNAYRHEYEDLITTEMVGMAPLTFRWANVDTARARGVDAGVEMDVARAAGVGGDHRIRVGLNVARLDTEGSSSAPSENGKNLPFRPDLTVSPVVRYGRLAWGTDLNLWATYRSAQFTSLDNQDEIGSHWLLSAKLVQRLGNGFSGFVEGTNLTDRDQTGDTSVRVIGRRSVVAGVTYHWN